MYTRTLVLLALSVLPGCMIARRGVDRPLEQATLRALEPGRTTAREVVEALGAPSEVVQLGRGSAYRYDHSRTKQAGLWLVVVFLFNEDTRADRAWLFFDEAGTLTHYGASLAADDAKWAMPWVDVHE